MVLILLNFNSDEQFPRKLLFFEIFLIGIEKIEVFEQ